MFTRITVLFVVILALLLVACMSVTEAFGLKCPAFVPIVYDPVIADAPRPPTIGLSDKPI